MTCVTAWRQGRTTGSHSGVAEGSATPDPFASWASRQGWRIARDVPRNVLRHLPGPPFHESGRKSLPVLTAGRLGDLSAIVMQIDYRPGGEPGSVSRGNSAVAVVELAHPVPDLAVTLKRSGGPLGTRRWRGLFQRRVLEVVPIDREGRAYQVSGAPEFVRRVVSRDRLALLTQRCSPRTPYFRFSGNKVIAWWDGPVTQPKDIDALLGLAEEVMRWIPAAAQEDSPAPSTTGRHLPLERLPIPFD